MAIATVTALLLGTVAAVPAQAAPSTVAKKTFSNTTPVAVPDGAPLVEGEMGTGASPIEVTGLTGSITKVTASVYLTHGRLSDLDAAILPPDPGMNFEVFAYLFRSLPGGTNLGTSCADADRTVFDDSAGLEIDQGSAPYVGAHRPDGSLLQPLSVLNNNAGGVNGTWTFDVIDTVPGEVGTIACWSLFITTDSGQDLRFDSTGPVAIGDAIADSGGPGVATSSIAASGLRDTISSVTVAVWVTHPNVSDLTLALVSPSGTTVTLAAGVGGTGDNFGTSCSRRTTFDDTAKTFITAASPPFVGTYRPQSGLGALANGLANGTWTLRVSDAVAGSVGTIMCWSLTVTSSTSDPGTPPSDGVVLTPLLLAPAPLPGAYNYPHFTLTNNTSSALTNVTLTSTLASTWADVRADTESFPDCVASGNQITCTWAHIGPGASVRGGAVAKVNASRGSVCVDGTVTATDISPVRASRCFSLASYPKKDRGTGYAVGDRAHDLVLQDQQGQPVALSQFAGKYVLLQFTAVWCPPSNVEVPQDRDEIAALNAANAMGREVVYLTVLLDGPSVNVASTQTNASNWAAKYHLTTPVLFTTNDTAQAARQQFWSYSFVGSDQAPSVPTSVFIRPDGRIFDLRVGLQPEGDTTARFLADLN